MATVFSVRVDTQTFKPQEQVAENSRWTQALALAHRQDLTVCLCDPVGRPKLSIKRYTRENGSSVYGLARWRYTGLDHDPDCSFFAEEQEGAGQDQSAPAFEEGEDGTVRAYLAMGMSVQVSSADAVNTPRERGTGAGGKSRARASEIALLQRLWRMASLDVLRGCERSWFKAVYVLLKAAERMVIGKDGRALSDYLLVGSRASDQLACQHNAAVLERIKATPSRVFVIGRLRTFDQTKGQMLLPLKEYDGLPKILVTGRQLATLIGQRQFAQNLLHDGDGNVVVIACIEPKGPTWWQTVSMACLPTSLNMVPVESSYEVAFERHLVDLKRTFIKPIAVGDDAMRPDFILLDTAPRTYCEVWGMQTEEYLRSKDRRIREYAKRGKILVSWNAAAGDPIPPLPPIVKRSA
jgi:hypothetical protein